MLVTVAEGLISYEDVAAHLREERSADALDAPELIDASGATTDLTPDQVRMIVDRLMALKKSQPFGITAVVATNDVFYGMIRMLGILSELQGGPVVE
ncbi:MAG TPA: hypothetical protein VHB50_17280, partial [Bryobacteraceae bacterium]|nr:hypothetical protein [Bryobacteraceae bacterium]